LENIKANPLAFPGAVKVSDESKDLMKKMLAYDEDSRISAADLFKHQLINLQKKWEKKNNLLLIVYISYWFRTEYIYRFSWTIFY